jgi:small subunit ribosomal protein S17
MSTERGNRRVLSGIVKTAGEMDKTITVVVERRVKHALIKKYILKHKKYLVHDEHNEFKVGDRVRIIESKPISKNKRWRIHKLSDPKQGE